MDLSFTCASLDPSLCRADHVPPLHSWSGAPSLTLGLQLGISTTPLRYGPVLASHVHMRRRAAASMPCGGASV